MTKALPFQAVVRGKALPLPDLSAFEGKRVEVLVLADDDQMLVSEGADESDAPPRRRVFGGLRGKLHVPDDFDTPLPEDIQKYFEGRGDEVEEGK